MKNLVLMVLTILAVLMAVGPFSAVAAEPKDKDAQKRAATAQAPSAPTYKPPLRGAPGGRVGGGTRGTSARDIFVLSVLAPDHTGLTTKEQPCLFWFISAPTALPVEVTIVDPNATAPLLEAGISPPVEKGVHRIRLADYGVRLASGVAYQWSVAVIPDPDRRSRDILASGTIERVAAAGEPSATEAGKEDLVSRYAEAGLWYDALEAVADMLERSPADATALRFRAALLAQTGLPEISE